MSQQKTVKRTNKQTEVEENGEFKAPPGPAKNGGDAEEAPPSEESSNELNGNGTDSKETENVGITTRSRSNTPQIKNQKIETAPKNGTPPKVGVGVGENPIEEAEVEKNNSEMDEPDPELLFDDNSDLESGKGSPVLTRCQTRRSQTRNIPTPKTPKVPDEDLVNKIPDIDEKTSITETEQVEEDISIRAQVGSDSTRLNFTTEESIFLNLSKKQSFTETLRGLSTRRTIRPINEQYYNCVSSNLSRDKVDMNLSSYPKRYSIERVSVASKRKRRSESEESRKRFKSESPGIFSYLSTPLVTLKNQFKSDLPSSTPKLTGYKDKNLLLEFDSEKKEEIYERKWCSIM